MTEARRLVRPADGMNVSVVMEARRFGCGAFGEAVSSDAVVEVDSRLSRPKQGLCTEPRLLAGRLTEVSSDPHSSVEVCPPDRVSGDIDVSAEIVRLPVCGSASDVSMVKETRLPFRPVDAMEPSMVVEARRTACRVSAADVFSEKTVESDTWLAGHRPGICTEPRLAAGRFAN